MISYRKHGLRFVEQWMGEPSQRLRDTDISIHYQLPAPSFGDFSIPFWSLVVRLDVDEKTLQDALDKDTRYEIRRAQSKDGLNAEFLEHPSASDLEAFAATYNPFARAKGIAPLFEQRLRAQAQAGVLRLSRITRDGEDLVWHAYVVVASKAALLYSASGRLAAEDASQRALTGRANRLLHWLDILSLKSLACNSYDFGGWYAGKEDEQKLRINRFKEGFGGSKVEQCTAYSAHSLLGAAYLQLVRLRHRKVAAEAASRSGKATSSHPAGDVL